MQRGGGSEADRRRRVNAGVGIALAAVVVIGLIVVTRRDGDWPGGGGGSGGGLPGQRSADQTVTDFFAAQAAGDCAALLELVTEDSWSAGGRRTADEFLAQCEDALDGYHPITRPPMLAGVLPRDGVAPADGDRAEVAPTDPATPSDRSGSLVGEDGQWKVELDPDVLHLGRTPAEAVAAYVEAYNTGDCDMTLDLLSERAWSREGRRSRDDFLAACTDRATARQASDEVDVVLHDATTTTDATTTAGDSGADASATVAVRFDPPLAPPSDPPDGVRLVRDGLEWVLDANLARSDAEPLLLELTYRDLQHRLLDEVEAGGRSCSGTDEKAEAPGTIAGLRRSFFDCYVRISLLQVADPAAAAGAIDAVVAERQEIDNSARPAAVPGSPEATGIIGDCDDGMCTEASVLQADGDVVVQVELQTSDDIGAAAAILQAQLER
jgi:hypothetical protein